VLNSSSSKLGVIISIGAETAEVDLAGDEGIISVPWTELHKHIVVGDFVEGLSGPLRESTGWVERVDDEIVHVVQHLSSETLEENQHYRIKVDYMLASATWTNFTSRNSKFILIG
jgi:transcription elongation factor